MKSKNFYSQWLLVVLLLSFVAYGTASAECYQFVTKWGSLGTGDGQFSNPAGVAIDSSGNVYVTEQFGNRIQKFNSSGTFITKWGSSGSGNGQFSEPNAVAVDSSGNVYVAEEWNHRIQKFSSSGTFITKWGSYGSGDGQFYRPRGVAIDSSGNVCVGDRGNARIQKFSSSGTFITKWGSYGSGDGQFNNPLGVAIDSSGNVYVVDFGNNRIQKFSSSGTFITKWGSFGSGDGQFNYPTDITIDSSGNVYVDDNSNHRIQKFSSSGTFITKWGTQGSGDGQLNYPHGIAVDASGGVCVADTMNHRIQKFSPCEPGGTWTQLIQNGTSIGGMAYAYDSNRNRGVIFGGDNSSLNQLSSTYEWNGTSWTLITSNGPSSRANSAMAFDTMRGKSVLFGGWVKPDNYHGETWTWDGTQWSQVSSTGPHARASQAMAFDSSRGKVVLFGGSYYQTIYGDTWEWDGTSWTQVSSGGPSSRLLARMAYDEARGKVVLFGGQTTYYGTFFNDTWEWDGTSWQQVASTGPSARSWHTMAYDSTRQRVVLFGGGGWGRAESFSDLWEWNGASWVQINASGPSVRIGACLFYDKTLNVMILYGGYNNGSNYSTLGDTWKYVAPVTNTAQVANAGSDQSVSVGNTVTLDGSGSTDVDGNLLTYSWAFTTMPTGSTATLTNPTLANPTFMVDKAGTYVVSLTVNDGTVNSSADTVTISTLNSAPVANAGAGQSVFVGNTVTLDGSGSTDVDGNLLTYSWAFTTRPDGSIATLSDTSSVNPTFTVDKAGTYVVSLIVNDGTVNSSADTVTISTLNSAPVANAGADQSVFVGNTVTLDGSGSTDVDGNLLTYTWAFTTRPDGSTATLANPTSVNPTFTVDKAGTYVVSLTVSDDSLSSIDTVMISTINVAPVADAGTDQTITAVGTTVQLDGTQSYDPDGDSITYQWTFASIPAGSTASISNADTSMPTFVADVRGEYLVQLVVNDASMLSSYDTVTISFTNIKPVADAGTSQSVNIGDIVTLDGSGSSDANGDTLTYSWTLTTVPTGSLSAITNPTAMVTTFVPDVAGTYVVQLIVNDGTVDSDPSTVQIQAVDALTAAIQAIQDCEAEITSLDSSVFKNANMQNTLINKLNAVIANIEAGNYADALGQLQNDILGKTDGCANSGSPDKNDWIKSCEAQSVVYPCIQHAISVVEGLMT